jgi:hypothetical protein
VRAAGSCRGVGESERFVFWQTRDYFKRKYGRLADNPEVGRELTEVYWRPGNGASFLELVEKLTGAPLAADAWVAALELPTEKKVRSLRRPACAVCPL